MPVYPSATAMLPAGTRTRGVASRGTASARGAPVMYGYPGAKPRKATRWSAAACSRTSSSPETPARCASASRSGPASPPYSAASRTVRGSALLSRGSIRSSSSSADAWSSTSGSKRTSSVRAPGMASSRPGGRRRARALATATAARFASASANPGYSRSTAPSTTWRTSGVIPPFSRRCVRRATAVREQWSSRAAAAQTRRSVADHEHHAVVLGVDPPIGPDRQRRVRRAEGELREHGVDELAVAVDLVQVSVLAVREGGAVPVDGRGVHALLEVVGMVGNARERAVRAGRAAQRVRVLEAPVDLEVRRQRADEKLLGICRVRRIPVGRADRRVVAVGADVAVVVLLGDDRELRRPVRRCGLEDG